MTHEFTISDDESLNRDVDSILHNCLIASGLKPVQFRSGRFTLQELHELGVKNISISHNPIFSTTHIRITT